MPDHDPTRRYLCRHVHTNGHRCGSPALRAQKFCYYHDRTRLPNAPLAGRIGIFKMQPIDDRAAIQIALYDVLSRVTAGDIDTKRASTILYGLQIASSNLARLEKLQPATETVEDITFHDTLGDLAPIEEIPEPQPTAPDPVILSEARSAQSKDPRICDTNKTEATPTHPNPRHSEPQAQNLRISATPPLPPPASITLAAVQATAPEVSFQADQEPQADQEQPCHESPASTAARFDRPPSRSTTARSVTAAMSPTCSAPWLTVPRSSRPSSPTWTPS